MANNNSSSSSLVSEWDVDAYLFEQWETQQQLPIAIMLTITVIYVLLFVSGVVGNVVLCIVLIRNRSMHTATNCYLFSLAVSDLTVLLLGLPNDLSLYWQRYPFAQSEIICKLRAFIAEMTAYASVLTIVAFSLERYLAICHPLHAYRMAGVGRALRSLAVIWFLALVSAVPFAVNMTVDHVSYPEEAGPHLVGQPIAKSAFCAMLDEPEGWPMLALATFIFFIVPMILLCVLYIRIAIRLRRGPSGFQQNSIHHHPSASKRTCYSNNKNIIRMLVAVVIGFFVCWAPFHAQRLLYVYAKESPSYRHANEVMFYITGCFYYLASTINPILYNVTSVRYREAFRKTIFCCCHSSRSSRSGHSTLNSSSGGSTRTTSNVPSIRSQRRDDSLVMVSHRDSLKLKTTAAAAAAAAAASTRVVTSLSGDNNRPLTSTAAAEECCQ